MKKLLMKINHKGSTLLMVIICLALIGILGSLMLSVSMVNYQMKTVENNSKKNFYTCEKALEEIKSGLEEMSATAIGQEYEDVLKNYVLYSILNETARSNKIRGEVIDKLSCNTVFSKRSITQDGYKEYKEDLSALFTSYLSEPVGYTITLSKDSVDSPVDIVKDEAHNTYYLLFKDVKIEYIENSYKTSITTDIRLTIPSFTFSAQEDTLTYSMEQPYAGYALAADGEIQSINSDGTNTIRGNVYAGNGITVSDTGSLQKHIVNITGNNIITRGDITAKNTATLNIGNSSNVPVIWADNLVTDTTGYYSTIAPTTLNVNAICLVKDDLTLNGRNSAVTMKGAYIGYTGQHTAEGSSVIINGTGSGLDLSNLSTLLLAGRAHISVEDSKLGTINTSVMTGESLAFKSNQRAYMVPGEFIRLKLATSTSDPGYVAKHNPITDGDLTDTNGAGATVNYLPVVSVTNSNLKTFLGNTTEKAYLNSTDPYRLISKQTTLDSHILRYYYLNFASGRMCDQFFADYYTNYKAQLQLMGSFQPGNVRIPDASDIYSVGNILSYQPASIGVGAQLNCMSGLSGGYTDDTAMDKYIANKKFQTLDNSTESIFKDTILEGKKISNLSELFFNMTHYLSPTTSSFIYKDADKAVASTIKNSGINEVIADSGAGSAVTGFTYNNTLPADSNTLSIVVMDGDVVIPTGFNGLLITTGKVTIGAGAKVNGIIIAADKGSVTSDVTVGNGATIYGRIIATGNIILGENCTIDCTQNTSFNGAATDMAVEEFLYNLFKTNGKLLWKLFVNPDVSVNIASGTVASDLVNIDNLVTCENWRKN